MGIADSAHGIGDLRIELFGGFRVAVGSRVVDEAAWRLRKAVSVVKLLALAPEHRLHRDHVMELLWPDSEPEAAANNLHRTLHVARRALEPALTPATPSSYLHLNGDTLALSPAGGVWTDVDAFRLAGAAARRARIPLTYEIALELYKGDLLPDDRYEDWATARREELRDLYLALLIELAHLHEGLGTHAAAIQALERVVSNEPAHEEAHVGLMRLFALMGRRSHALRQYRILCDALRREIETEPAAESQRLYREILESRFSAVPRHAPADADAGAGDASPANTGGDWPSTLPIPSTSFVGRDKEIAEVARRLMTSRLLTLTGAGGSGKTRLALHTAAALHATYPDGVWLVELAPLNDGAHVEQAVATALGVREKEKPSRPLGASLVEALRAKRFLVILDNCEHVLHASAALATILLRECPHASLLATSRESLNIAGETVWSVPPLSLPDPSHLPPCDRLLEYDAARLFLERARANRPGFALTPQNAATVAHVCRRLDGIPLAIELAAARVNVLSVEEIAARLDDCFRLLVSHRPTELPHHQTLRATIDWSYVLLSEPERVLFQRLSTFAGGWTLEAAETVCADEGIEGIAGIEPRAILDLLSQLVERSLVITQEHDGQIRCRLLETIQQYGREKLAAAREDVAVRGRHAAWCLALAETAEPELTGARLELWLGRLETEHDNLRAALQWTLHGKDAQAGLRLCGALWRFWFQRGYLREGRVWAEQALAAAASDDHVDVGVDAMVRAKALGAAGSLAFFQGDYAHAAERHEQSLALYRQSGDVPSIAGALNNLGNVAQYRGDYTRATALHEESLALRRQVGDTWGVAGSLSNLATVQAEQGDYAAAEALLGESLTLRRQVGDMVSIALALGNLGVLARCQGAYDRAAALLEESLSLRRKLGDTWGTANVLANLGNVAVDQGAHGRAAVLYAESLAICRDIGDQKVTAYNLEGLAAVASAQGHMQRSARLCGAAAALREDIGAPLPVSERAIYDRTLAAARIALGEGAFSAAWTVGRSLSLSQAITYALATEDACFSTAAAPVESPESPESSGDHRPVSLSKREHAIATLIVDGRTNRQIAAALGIAERTVDTHVGNILGKLGVATRTQVAARLESHGNDIDGAR